MPIVSELQNCGQKKRGRGTDYQAAWNPVRGLSVKVRGSGDKVRRTLRIINCTWRLKDLPK